MAPDNYYAGFHWEKVVFKMREKKKTQKKTKENLTHPTKTEEKRKEEKGRGAREEKHFRKGRGKARRVVFAMLHYALI